jgi:hypothetical protein
MSDGAGRKYSVADIDRMRAAVRGIFPGSGLGIDVQIHSSDPDSDRRYQMDGAQNRSIWENNCEEKLRTYMLAGVDPDELEAQAKLKGQPDV